MDKAGTAVELSLTELVYNSSGYNLKLHFSLTAAFQRTLSFFFIRNVLVCHKVECKNDWNSYDKSCLPDNNPPWLRDTKGIIGLKNRHYEIVHHSFADCVAQEKMHLRNLACLFVSAHYLQVICLISASLSGKSPKPQTAAVAGCLYCKVFWALLVARWPHLHGMGVW